jgi:hypothetical protein
MKKRAWPNGQTLPEFNQCTQMSLSLAAASSALPVPIFFLNEA